MKVTNEPKSIDDEEIMEEENNEPIVDAKPKFDKNGKSILNYF